MVVSITNPSSHFDFDWEAETAAVNEACVGTDAACSLGHLCIECMALKKMIKGRLIRAFEFGRVVGQGEGDAETDHQTPSDPPVDAIEGTVV